MGVSVFKYVAIVLVNSALLCVLCRSWHSSTNLKRNHQPQRSPKSEMYLKSGAILCASTALYLSAQLPMLVFNMRIYSRDHGGGDGYPKSSQLFATPFVQMAFLANYSLNFYLYFTVSTRFRDGLRDICRRGSRFVQSPNTSATALSTIPMSTSTDFLARTLVLASGDQFMSDTPLALETTSKEAKTTQDERDIMHEDDATPPPQRDRIEPRFSIGNVDIQR